MTKGQPTLDCLRCPRFRKSSRLLCMTRSRTDSYSPLKCVFITYITSSPSQWSISVHGAVARGRCVWLEGIDGTYRPRGGQATEPQLVGTHTHTHTHTLTVHTLSFTHSLTHFHCLRALWLCSIRALFGESVVANAVHGSSSVENAQVAIQTFVGEVPEEGEGETEGGDK